MNIAWTALAVRDLVEIRKYVGLRNREAARKLGRQILDEVRKLRRFPGLGRPGRVSETRELVVIEILRVLHGART